MRKLLLLLFILSPFFAAAQSNVLEKKVSVHFTETTLEKVLATLNKEYSFEFSYSDDIIPVKAIINLSAENENLKTVLERLFKDFNITYKVINNRIVLSSPLTQTIRGLVIDQSTNAPIPGANVLIEETSPVIGGTTNAEGQFTINNVPVGRPGILITCIGYTPKKLANILLGTGKEVVLEVKLAESITQVEEVLITAKRSDTRHENELALVSARSFSVEETKRYAASLGDPARLAASFAGVTGASDESNALAIRGNSPRGVLWRVEGIEVPNPNHFTTEGASGGVVSILSTNIINNADFLTGAFPAEYGNALSGVLDISLRNGNNKKQEHSFQAGILGIETATEGPFHKNHAASYLVNYRYSTLSVLDKLGFDLNEAGEYKNYQDFAFKINYPTSNSGTLSLFGIGGLSRSNLADTSKQDNNYADMGVLGLKHQQTINKNTSILSAVSLSGTHISKHYEVLGLNSEALRLEENYTKSYLRASVTAKRRISSKYLLEGGLIYSRLFYDFFLLDLDSANVLYTEIINFREEDNTGISQGYIQAKHSFSPDVQAVYGLHFLRFGLTNDNSLEPRVQIRWQAASNKAFSAGFGKHSKIENLQYYLARDHQQGGNEVQINKNLGFTRANHYVLGYEQFLQPNLLLKLESYYQDLYNSPVQLDPSALYAVINEETGFISDTLINNGKGRNYGLELSIKKSFSNDFYYLVNGSIYQSKFKIAEGQERNTAYNGNFNVHLLTGYEFEYENRANQQTLGINIRVTWAGGNRYVPIDIEESITEGRQIHNMESAFEPKLPNYFRADLQINYRKNKPGYSTEWRLDIQNFTNHLNPAYYYYDAENESTRLKSQIGLLPILSYRIDF